MSTLGSLEKLEKSPNLFRRKTFWRIDTDFRAKRLNNRKRAIVQPRGIYGHAILHLGN